MGNPIIDMNNVQVEHHFHLFEIKGFLSFTLKKISFVRIWLNNIATLALITPRIIMNMIS